MTYQGLAHLTMQQEQRLAERVKAGICDKCHQKAPTVDQQYSFGVYAGILCESCARRGYVDQCGFRPEGQGTRNEYEELAGPGTYDDDY